MNKYNGKYSIIRKLLLKEATLDYTDLVKPSQGSDNRYKVFLDIVAAGGLLGVYDGDILKKGTISGSTADLEAALKLGKKAKSREEQATAKKALKKVIDSGINIDLDDGGTTQIKNISDILKDPRFSGRTSMPGQTRKSRESPSEAGIRQELQVSQMLDQVISQQTYEPVNMAVAGASNTISDVEVAFTKTEIPSSGAGSTIKIEVKTNAKAQFGQCSLQIEADDKGMPSRFVVNKKTENYKKHEGLLNSMIDPVIAALNSSISDLLTTLRAITDDNGEALTDEKIAKGFATGRNGNIRGFTEFKGSTGILLKVTEATRDYINGVVSAATSNVNNAAYDYYHEKGDHYMYIADRIWGLEQDLTTAVDNFLRMPSFDDAATTSVKYTDNRDPRMMLKLNLVGYNASAGFGPVPGSKDSLQDAITNPESVSGKLESFSRGIKLIANGTITADSDINEVVDAMVSDDAGDLQTGPEMVDIESLSDAEISSAMLFSPGYVKNENLQKLSVGSKMKKYKIKRKDLALVVEAIKYIHTDSRGRRLMREACGDAYPDVHTDESGRMMDYGHDKSDSHEGRMTKAKLFRMAQMAQRLHDKLVDADDLPEWVQDKITTAEDRLKSAHDYITYKIHRMENL